MPVLPRDERGDVQREAHRVEERVHGPDPAGVVLEMAPVVQSRERCRHGAEDPDRERVVRGGRAREVERERGRPRPDRHVGQRRMERIAEPDAVEHVPHRLRHGVHGLLHRVGELVERLGEVGELLREAEIRHRTSRPRPAAAGNAVLRVGDHQRLGLRHHALRDVQ